MTLTEAVSAIELKEKMEDSSDSTSCCDDTSHSTASSDITSVSSNSSIQSDNNSNANLPGVLDEELFKCAVNSLNTSSSTFFSKKANNSVENSRLTDGNPLLKAPHCFREATLLERVQALCEGRQNVGEASHGDVKDSQEDATLRGYNSTANVAQNLMLAANIERIFSLQQLGSRDFARIDAFLKDDLYLTFRELVTKDVVTPTPSQIRDGLDNDFTVFSVTQALKSLNAHCKALTSVHIEVSEGPWDNEQKMLEWIAQTTTLISNINCQRNIIDRRLIPRIFGQPQDIAKIASGLAQFGVSPLKIDTLYTDADTTLCYAYEIISKLQKALKDRFQSQTNALSSCRCRPTAVARSPTLRTHHRSSSPVVTRSLERSSSRSPPAGPRSMASSARPPSNYRGCIFCGGRSHYTAMCKRTRRLSVRANHLVKGGRCIKCLSRHDRGQCKRRSWCLYCHAYSHHQALCSKGDVVDNDVSEPLEQYYTKISASAEKSYASYHARKRRHSDSE